MAAFDPYHKWLGIPADQQPANYYRLLGIEEFEVDADVIDTAAEHRTVFLRTFQTGPNSELAARLLNEVSAARVCLLDGKSKALYDTQLRTAQQAVTEDDPLAFMTEQLAADSSKPSARSRSRSGKPIWKEPWVILTAAGVAAMALLIFFSSGGDKLLPVQNDPRENNEDINKKMSWFQNRVDELEAELDEAYQKASVHQRQQSTKLNDRFAIVTVKNMHPVPLTTSILTSKTKIKCNDDNQLPQIFHKATTWVVKDGAPWQESNAWLRFRVEQSGRMYLIAHWQYEGNANRGGWQNQRISLPHLKQGWNLIGRASWDPEVYFFSRLVDVGEEYEIRTNKYWPPYLIADVAASEEPGDKPMLLPGSKP